MDVNQSAGKQSSKEAEISCEAVYTLSALRQGPRGLSQVQNLPDLFQNAGQRGKDPGGEESQLVEGVEYEVPTVRQPGDLEIGYTK